MKIPGVSFWALLTAVLLYLILNAIGGPEWMTIGFAVLWYLIGVGAASAVYRHHHPIYEEHTDKAFSAFDITGEGLESRKPEGMYAVTFENQNATAFVPAGGNLLKYAKDQGVHVYYDVNKLLNCMGHGFCGTCRFTADQKAPDALSKPTWQEGFTLGGDVGKVRLACQTNVLGDCKVDNSIAEEFGEVRRYAVGNATLFGVFSLVMLGLLLWIGGDMIGLF